MQKITLLGGSNSLMKSIAYGLAKGTDFVNLALGGSSSIQNLAAIIRYRERIIESDLIVTESNCNDSFNTRSLDVEPALLRPNIDAFYRELAVLNRNCVVVITPVRQVVNCETEDAVQTMIASHRTNAQRHGLMLVDLPKLLQRLDPQSLAYLVPDSRHPNHAFMAQLGIELADFATHQTELLQARKLPPSVDPSPYYWISGKEIMPGAVTIRQNRAFREEVVEIPETPIPLPERARGDLIVAVGTWSDDDSGLRIDSGAQSLVKLHNNLNSLNEIVAPIAVTRKATMSSMPEGRAQVTERTVLVDPNTAVKVRTKVTGLLMRRAPPRKVTVRRDDFLCLNHLAPDPLPYIESVRFFHEKRVEA